VKNARKSGDGGRPKKAKPRRKDVRVEGLLGIGLDGSDGHTRVTQGDGFFLVGGSAETHGKMQDFTIRITERLARKGKRIPTATLGELRDIADDLKG
jgi:hypothetical protein